MLHMNIGVFISFQIQIFSYLFTLMLFFPSDKVESLVVKLSYNEDLVAKSYLTLATPRTIACLSVGFSRQEYWSGLPLPSPCHMVVLLFMSLRNLHMLFHSGCTASFHQQCVEGSLFSRSLVKLVICLF